MSVALIYFSEYGTTHQVASAISDGVGQCDCACHLLRITTAHIVAGRFVTDSSAGVDYLDVIDQSDAVIFGSPTYMGGPAAQFKAFADATSDRWDDQLWNGKLAAGFTVGSNPGGDQLATLSYFSILAAQHGMLWVNLNMPSDHEHKPEFKLNAQLGFAGVVPSDQINRTDKLAAAQLGRRVAGFSKRLASGGDSISGL